MLGVLVAPMEVANKEGEPHLLFLHVTPTTCPPLLLPIDRQMKLAVKLAIPCWQMTTRNGGHTKPSNAPSPIDDTSKHHAELRS